MLRVKAAAVWVAAALLLGGCSKKSAEGQAGEAPLSACGRFIDDYFSRYFEFYPYFATAAGIHEYDSKLENFAAHNIKTCVAELNAFATQLADLRKGS